MCIRDRLSGAGHLVNFTGTDTVPAIDFVEDFYGADSDNELVGGSVPATEHSVMCMGTQEDEVDTFRRLVTELYPTGIVSIVSDTWDYWYGPSTCPSCETKFSPETARSRSVLTAVTR